MVIGAVPDRPVGKLTLPPLMPAPDAPGLVSVSVMIEVPPAATVVGANATVIAGTAADTTVSPTVAADALLPEAVLKAPPGKFNV